MAQKWLGSAVCTPHPTSLTLLAPAPHLVAGPIPYIAAVGALEITTRLMPKERQAATEAHFQKLGEKMLERAERDMAKGDHDLAAWRLVQAKKLFNQASPSEKRSAIPAKASGRR